MVFMKVDMPYSSLSGKAFCDRTVIRITNQLHSLLNHRVLDLGVGSGTYSDRYASDLLSRPKFHWTGVEIWKPYIDKFALVTKYDKLVNDDAISYLSSTSDRFDICFIGDLIEHMDKDSAIKMIHLALSCSNVVIVSVPIIYYPQGEYDGNQYEEHVKPDWSHKEAIDSFPMLVEYGVENEIGVYVLSSSPGLVSQVLKPQIAVYAICKNEEKFIRRWYKSVEDADFISIVDTGSTDSTFQLIQDIIKDRSEHFGHEEEYFCSDGIVSDEHMTAIKGYINPWRFDDARNMALNLLPLDPDVCISVDIDEVLVPGWKELLCTAVLEDLHKNGKPADRYNHSFSTIWNWEQVENGAEPNKTEHWHERIHARTGYMWKLPVHEMLIKGGPEVIKWIPSLKMIQKPDMSKERSSYLKMLEQSLLEMPNRWKSWSFYASDLVVDGRLDEAIEALNKAKKLPDADVSFLSFQLSGIYQKKKDWKLAVQSLQVSVSLSDLREYRVWLARLYHSINKPNEALIYANMAYEITNQTTGYVYDPSCWDSRLDTFVEQLKQDIKNGRN